MGACGKVAAACILGVLGALPQGAARAGELTILTNQGATPGVRELAAAFERATGHKVTVIQEAGAALDRRLASGGPADLIASNPAPFDDLVKKGKGRRRDPRRRSCWPGSASRCGRRAEAGHQHGRGL